MNPTSIGIIGCGKISEKHILACKSLGIKISFLVDLNMNRMNELALKYSLNNVLMFQDYLLAIEKKVPVNFVTIATSSGSHFQIASRFVIEGYNVLIEKPVSLSLSDARNLSFLAKNHNVTVGVIHPNRFFESINLLKKSIANNEFGRIFHVTLAIRLNRGMEYYNESSWR